MYPLVKERLSCFINRTVQISKLCNTLLATFLLINITGEEYVEKPSFNTTK